MKLRDIIEYIDFLMKVKILQMDAYLETSEHYGELEEVFCGNILDVPWWVADMYLDKSDNESIYINKEEDCLEIYVRENMEDNK